MFKGTRKFIAILALSAGFLAVQIADSPGWHHHTQLNADCLLCLGSPTAAVATQPDIAPVPAARTIYFLPLYFPVTFHARSIYPIRGSPLA